MSVIGTAWRADKNQSRDFIDTTAGFGLALSREWGRVKSSSESSKETLIAAISTVPLGGEDLLLHLNLGNVQFSDYRTFTDSRVFTIGFGITPAF
jgi:hypothetical protein